MKKISAILILLATLFCLISCEEKEKIWTELPPATESGVNTIGCMVDGQLWATGKLPGYTLAPAMYAEYSINNADSKILKFYAEGEKGTMSFYIENPIIGENENVNVFAQFSFLPDCKYKKNDIGTVIITKLETNVSPIYTSTRGIISGTFSFNLPCETDSSKLIIITDGRFDLVLSTQR